MKRFLLSVLGMALVFLLPAMSHAAVITVDLQGGGDYTEIQPAIDAAEDGDTVLVKPGVYVITHSITFEGKPITVRGELGAAETTISVGPVDTTSVVVFENGESKESILQGFTLTCGQPGIRCSAESSPTLIDCTITENRGGLTCSNSSPTLIRCLISRNASRGGGGVSCWSDSSPTLVDCKIIGNQSRYGGGLYSSRSSPTLLNCEIVGNGAGKGGGIYLERSPATLTNCLIVANCCSTSGGGGVYVEDSEPTLTNCTITANRSSDGPGGLICEDSSPTLTNCILWDNGDGSVDADGNCPLQVSYSLIEGDEVWPGERNSNQPPHFVFPGIFGFERRNLTSRFGDEYTSGCCMPGLPDFIIEPGDYRLQPGSAGVDAATAAGSPATDLEGNDRPCWDGVDMGVYEYCGFTPPAAIHADFAVTPESGLAPLTVEVDAAAAGTYPGGSIVTYDWDFGDGTVARGITASHTYIWSGDCTIRLTIGDDLGQRVSSTRQIRVLLRSGSWTSADVGGPLACASGSRFVDECLQVRPAQGNISDRVDRFHFVYQPLEGDVTITAQVSRLRERHPRERFGVMLRESLEPDAAHASMLLEEEKPRFSYRRTGGRSTGRFGGSGDASFEETWVRIERRGNLFIGSSSRDGRRWTEAHRVTLELPETLFGGIAATAGTGPESSIAEFCNLEVGIPQSDYFLRGDCNADGSVDTADGVSTLVFLFAGGQELPCRDAADTDDSGQIDINDSVGTFNWLFQSGAPPAPPGHLQCGDDPTDDLLGCANPPDCR